MRLAAAVLLALLALPAAAERFFIGSPVLQDLWVDPVNGNDSRSGSSRANALQTITEAWNRIPFNQSLNDTGYRIVITGGTVPESAIPNFLEGRRGTSNHPVVIQSADPAQPARLAGDLNVYNTRYLFLLDLIIAPEPAGDAFHCELCDTIVIRNCTLDGGGAAQETIKINQSQRIYIEDSTITGAYENAIDFVSVQRASIAGNRIHDAGDWCAYVKGGSAYIRVEENDIYDCGTGGFTAGQGTGFQFMTSPWLHYEAYDVKVVNNVIHDTEGAALGVNGGYNILLAHNTMYRVGSTSHMLELVFGGRSCDGQPGDPGRERCAGFLLEGGWGTTVVDDGDNFVRIPNRNVFIYNNIFYNPAGFVSPQHFTIFAPYSGASQNGANVPVPARADENVQIRGNVIWNPAGFLGIGDESGCADTNPSCNAAQLVAENAINTIEPQLVNAPAGDFRPLANGNLSSARIYAIPPFTWIDAPQRPEVLNGNTNNTVDRDRNGVVRVGASPPGAYTIAAAGPARRRASRR
jgi:hypothetical protein